MIELFVILSAVLESIDTREQSSLYFLSRQHLDLESLFFDLINEWFLSKFRLNVKFKGKK